MTKSAHDPLIGQEIDGYKIEQLLGQGGMARVYRARDVRLKRYAAIKVINAQVRNPISYQERFDREARSVASLDHPNIVTVYRYNIVDGMYYMAMKYIDGADLGWILRNYNATGDLIDYTTMLGIMEQITGALDYAHKKGVIHRDIKPSNIMIDREGDAILTDFGLALIASEGTGGEIFGSPHYISPEQAINSAKVVTQSDLYSLGVILYEMLTGQIPFMEGSAMQIAMQHLSEPLPDPLLIKPDLNRAFVPVLQQALAKDPKDRYRSGKALFSALKSAVAVAQRDPKTRTQQSNTRTQPAERIAQHIAPLPVPLTTTDGQPDPVSQPVGTKPLTRMAATGELAAVPPSNQRNRRQFRMMLYLVLILLITASFAYTNPSVVDNAVALVEDNLGVSLSSDVILATVEGQITEIRGATLYIYDVPVQVNNSNDLIPFEQLAIGDWIRLEGNYRLTEEGIRFSRLLSAIIK